MTEAQARVLYEFQGFRVDPQQRLLLAGAGGEPIPLAPKVFDTLLYFIERRGELLDKATLMKAVWPNVVVEENSLNQNISALRRALKEAPGEHRFIVTEPGRGYRFVAEVRAIAATPVPDRPVPAAPTTPTAGKSIAVLPFANLTGDAAKDYLGEGMAEELIHMLARIPGLKVPSRTSVFAYKGRNLDVRQIARDLDVGVVLEGSIRTAGDRIRVTAQLIDGENGYHRWSQSYDREMGDLFKLQDELASAIVATLRVSLAGNIPGAMLQVPPTQNLEAYHLYLQAMAMQGVMGPANLPRVAALLRRSLELDPQFARAQSALASVRAVSLILELQVAGSLEEVDRDAQRAIELDSHVGVAHGALATIRVARGQWLLAEESFQAALAFDSSDPTLHQGYGLFLLGSAGFTARALESVLRAHNLAPAWLVNVMTTAVVYATNGQFEEAARYLRLAIEMGLTVAAPPLPDVLSNLDVHAGRFAEAARRYDGALIPSEQSAGGREVIEQVFAALGGKADRAAAVAGLEAYWNRLGADQIIQATLRRFMLWYTQLGALDQAFKVANHSFDRLARSGTVGTAWSFLWMPDMRAFRQDDRFQAIVTRMGLPEFWDKFGPPDNCDWRDGRLICR